MKVFALAAILGALLVTSLLVARSLQRNEKAPLATMERAQEVKKQVEAAGEAARQRLDRIVDE